MSKTGAKKAQAAKEQAGDMARTAAEAVSDKATREAARLRDKAADETETAADAAQAAADTFDGDTLQAQIVDQLAGRIEDLADQLREADVDQLAQRAGDTVRRHPMLFVAGAALAGFAFTRFLKAQEDHGSRPAAEDDPWQEDHEAPVSHLNLSSRGAVGP